MISFAGGFTQSDRDIAENLGFVPGPGIKEMLAQNLSPTAGTVQLVANPADGLRWQHLAHKPEEIMPVKSQAILTKKPVEDLSIAFTTMVLHCPGLLGSKWIGADAGESSEEELKDDVEAARIPKCV